MDRLLLPLVAALACVLSNASAQGPKEGCVCTTLLQPVCGVDGKDYGNPCSAECNGVEIACRKKCPCSSTADTDDPVEAATFAPWAEEFFLSPRLNVTVENTDCAGSNVSLRLRQLAPSLLLPEDADMSPEDEQAAEFLSITSTALGAPAYHYQLDNGRLFLCKRPVVATDVNASATGPETTDDNDATTSVSARLPSVEITRGELTCEAVMPGATKQFKYILGLSEMAVLAEAMQSGVGWQCEEALRAAPQASTAAVYLGYVLRQVIMHERLAEFGLDAVPTSSV